MDGGQAEISGKSYNDFEIGLCISLNTKYSY